jgi:hypothetical protein
MVRGLMAIVTRKFTKEYLGITATTYDSKIDLLIPHIEAAFERIRGIDFDEDSNDVIEYPENAEMIAAEMIGYKLQMSPLTSGAFDNKQSETIGSYSYTKGSAITQKMLMGFPISIVGQIERYQSSG